jgi:hypothetical protein
MSIFDSIHAAIAQAAAQAQQPAGQPAGQAHGATGGMLAGIEAVGAAAGQAFDVEQTLQDIARRKGNPNLNWRTSIVDLMKLVDLDSSLANRAQLADELGYTGAKNGSAEMNIWLHRRVMEELEKNGGHVPESLKG